jgi:hypothetical protein
LSSVDGQLDEHGGAMLEPAGHVDAASMLLHDALTDRKPEPGARRLRGEEGIEGTRPALRARMSSRRRPTLRATPRRVSGRTLMRSLPPLGMACTALETRLSNT